MKTQFHLYTTLRLLRTTLFCALLWFGPWVQIASGQAVHPWKNSVAVPAGSSEEDIARLAASVTPSPRQLNWQQMEFTVFLHFSVNTFYDQEWGKGTEDPALFNPEKLDASQWVTVCKDAGAKCIILTCKHHDGFCLWPSQYTTHSVAASPWLNGKGDIVKEVADACRRQGVKFGVYLSPWDRHEPSYGTEAYNSHFLHQLTELLTKYGDISEVWFDGACGEGPNGKRQVYDWPAYYSLIRKLQPAAVIAIMGPDVRWVGTESGYGRETEWSVVPLEMANQDSISVRSQQQKNDEGFIPPGDMMEADLGSRNKISKAKSLIWYPSEVDVSIRPGWFWHADENSRVKTPEKLLDIYFSSVGRNSLLLLNIPPNNQGLIADEDIHSLTEWRKALNSIFRYNLATGSVIIANTAIPEATLFDQDISTSVSPGKNEPFTLEFRFAAEKTFDILCLQENIRTGQRVEEFSLEALFDGNWKEITRGTTIGYKRLLRFERIHTQAVRLRVQKSRDVPALAEFGLYLNIPGVSASPSSAVFTGTQHVELNTEPACRIFYTLDGSEPQLSSKEYTGTITLTEPGDIRFKAVRPDGTESFTRHEVYSRADKGIVLKEPSDKSYPGKGPLTLVDGRHGSLDFSDGNWLGWNGTTMSAVLDLGSIRDIGAVEATFLEATASWIFPPAEVTFGISDDGQEFHDTRIYTFAQPTGDSHRIQPVECDFQSKARYIKVTARAIGQLPEWHDGRGNPAWIFCDEISVR